MTAEQITRIEENLQFVYSIATRIIGHEDPEYLSAAHATLVDCVLCPRSIAGSFRGYVGRAVRYAVLRQRYRNARYEFREDAYWNSLPEAGRAADIAELIEGMGGAAPILTDYYLAGFRPKDIAARHKLSAHKVRSILREALPELKRRILEQT